MDTSAGPVLCLVLDRIYMQYYCGMCGILGSTDVYGYPNGGLRSSVLSVYGAWYKV